MMTTLQRIPAASKRGCRYPRQPISSPMAVKVPKTPRMERLINRFAAIFGPVVHLPPPGLQCAKPTLQAIA